MGMLLCELPVNDAPDGLAGSLAEGRASEARMAAAVRTKLPAPQFATRGAAQESANKLSPKSEEKPQKQCEHKTKKRA